MVDIQPHTVLDESFRDGKPWLNAVERGFNKSITLDLTKFTNDAHKSPDGRFILSGVRLKKAASGGLYEPATVSGEPAAGEFEGVLFTAVEIVPGSTKSTAALMTHGAVTEANLPGGVVAGLTGPALIRVD